MSTGINIGRQAIDRVFQGGSIPIHSRAHSSIVFMQASSHPPPLSPPQYLSPCLALSPDTPDPASLLPCFTPALLPRPCSRTVGYRFGRFLQDAVPLAISYCQKAGEGDDELRDYCLQVRRGRGCVHSGLHGSFCRWCSQGLCARWPAWYLLWALLCALEYGRIKRASNTGLQKCLEASLYPCDRDHSLWLTAALPHPAAGAGELCGSCAR